MYHLLCWSTCYLSAEDAKAICPVANERHSTSQIWNNTCGLRVYTLHGFGGIYMYTPKKFQLPHKQLRGSRHNFLLIWSTAMWYNCGISQLRLRDEASAISNLGQVQWILLPFTSNRNSFGNLFSMRTLNTIENKSSASAINKNQEMCKPKFSDCPACRTWPNTCVEKPSLIYLGNFQ